MPDLIVDPSKDSCSPEIVHIDWFYTDFMDRFIEKREQRPIALKGEEKGEHLRTEGKGQRKGMETKRGGGIQGMKHT